MNKKFIFGVLITTLIYSITMVFANDSSELNRRLVSCTPTKDYIVGSMSYRISGLTDSICIYRIQYLGANSNRSDLICKVPFAKMRDMTSMNPYVVQKLKNRYCVVGIRSLEKPKGVYY